MSEQSSNRIFAAPRVSNFKPAGDAGLLRYSGYISDPDLRKLTGPRWIKVISEMSRTPVVGAVLFAVNQLIRKSEWTVKPADNSAEAKTVADFIEGCRGDMAVSWEDALSSLITFLPYGYSLHEIVYKRRLGYSISPVAHSSYEDGRIAWGDWAPRPQDTIVRWEFDDTGTVISAVQQPPMAMGDVTLPLAVKCIHLVSSSRNRSPEGESVLLPAFEAWKNIRHLQYYEAIGIERELAGLPVGEAPGEIISNPEHAAALRSWQEMVENVRFNEKAGIVIPSDVDPETKARLYDIRLLTTGGARAIDTNIVISRYQADLVETMLAGFITIGHGATGTYALASEKTRLFGLALQAWLDAIAEGITKQAIRPLIRLNGWDPNLSPTLHAGAPDNADLKRDGTFFKDIQSLITRLAPADVEALYDHLAAEADWPEREHPLGEPPPVQIGPGQDPSDPKNPAQEQDKDDAKQKEETS